MMERVGEFEKVSFNEYLSSQRKCGKFIGREFLKEYESIPLPIRKTKGSAGYDFFSPFSFSLLPHELDDGKYDFAESILIPTGIRCRIKEWWFLMLVPRSSLGFKYRLQMDNTVSIIDSDYYGNKENEGHIMLKITNDSRSGEILRVKAGDRIAQGIFLPYGITYDDDTTAERTGGIGSTNKE